MPSATPISFKSAMGHDSCNKGRGGVRTALGAEIMSVFDGPVLPNALLSIRTSVGVVVRGARRRDSGVAV